MATTLLPDEQKMEPTPSVTRALGLVVVVTPVTGSYSEMRPSTHVMTGLLALHVLSQISATVGTTLQSQVPVTVLMVPLPPAWAQNLLQ
jgi:hypothetical protein